MSQKKKSKRSLVPAKDLAVFCRQMSLVINSDITILEGVSMVREQADDETLRTAMEAVYSDMEQSITFADAMMRQSNVFPEYLLHMLRIGEMSGSLDTVLMTMSDYYEKEARVNRRVRAAVTYPVILATLMIGLIVLLVVEILPMFQDILLSMSGTMPWMTQALLTVSDFLGRYILFIIAGIALIVLLYQLYAHSARGRRSKDRRRVRYGITHNIHKRVITARLSRSLGILLHAGVPLLNALEMIEPLIGNVYVASLLEKARERLNNGEDLADILTSMDLFPPLFIRLVTVGHRTGRLEEMLNRSAAIFDDEIDESLERLTTAIEPVLIIVLSVIVGVILLSVMMPMINIMNTIG